jgi:hypothetical protein
LLKQKTSTFVETYTMSSPVVEAEKSTQGKGSKGSKVSVIVRCRPYLQKELDRGEGNKEIPFVINAAEGSIELPARNEGEQHTAMKFDHVYDMDSDTKDVYDEVLHDMVASTVEGYNGMFF